MLMAGVDVSTWVCRMPRERFFQFSWRPRPPTLLEPGQEEDISKNLKKYSQKYEQEDQALLAQVSGFPLLKLTATSLVSHLIVPARAICWRDGSCLDHAWLGQEYLVCFKCYKQLQDTHSCRCNARAHRTPTSRGLYPKLTLNSHLRGLAGSGRCNLKQRKGSWQRNMNAVLDSATGLDLGSICPEHLMAVVRLHCRGPTKRWLMWRG